VFVADGGVARRRRISVGPEQEGWRPVDGLPKGSEVVTLGRDQLSDGTRVLVSKGK